MKIVKQFLIIFQKLSKNFQLEVFGFQDVVVNILKLKIIIILLINKQRLTAMNFNPKLDVTRSKHL